MVICNMLYVICMHIKCKYFSVILEPNVPIFLCYLGTKYTNISLFKL